MVYRYETHLHTLPVSKCARVGVRENLEFYKEQGYDGVFITNHFLDGNIADCSGTYEDRLAFYFSDYEEALRLSGEIGIKVFLGVEISYKGTDFLIYGLDKAWYRSHPQIMTMKKTDELRYLMEQGALVIQAHPYREAAYIDHIRLFPRSVHGVEVFNACRSEQENRMAEIYAEQYGLMKFAGTDNHVGANMKVLSGMCSETPISSEKEFIKLFFDGKLEMFSMNNEN